MKRLARPAFCIGLLAIGFAQTGCFGEFALTRKAYDWHASIGSKWVRSILLWIPMGLVYGITATVDAVVLNLIEFWTGTNPLAMQVGDHEMQLVTIEGVEYRIEATKDTFTTTQLTGNKAGEVRIMRFDRSDRTWRYTDDRVKDQAILTLLDEEGDNIRVYTDRGSMEFTYADLQDKDAVLAMLGERFGDKTTASTE